MNAEDAPTQTQDARPPFAERYPRSPELDALVLAFEAGDYARVRRGAPELAASSDDEAVRAAARDLRARIEPSPAMGWIIVLTAVLLVALSWWWIAHDGPGGANLG